MALDLVIHIPDEFERDFKENKFSECFGRAMADIRYGLKNKNVGLCGNYEKETFEMFEKAFKEAKIYDEKTNSLKEVPYNFRVCSYYDPHFRGLEDMRENLTFDEMVEFAHEKVSDANWLKIECVDTGVEKTLDYDTYFENFEGEFPFSYDDFNLKEQGKDSIEKDDTDEREL